MQRLPLSLNGPFSSLVSLCLLHFSGWSQLLSVWGLPSQTRKLLSWTDDVLQSVYFYFQSQWRTISFLQYQALKHLWLSFLPSFYGDQRIDLREKLIRVLVTELVFFLRESPFLELTKTAIGLRRWLSFAFGTCGPLHKVLKIKVLAVLAANCFLLLKVILWPTNSSVPT